MRDNKTFCICLLASIWLHLGILTIILHSLFGFSGVQLITPKTAFHLLIHDTSSPPNVGNINFLESDPQIGSERVHALSSLRQNLSPRLTNELKSHFFSDFEVNTPATPVGEWVIDWTSWPPNEAQTISFTLWIDEKGRIVEWKLLGAKANLNQIRNAMTAIVDTPMNPAVLNGLPVPSVQNIELEFIPD